MLGIFKMEEQICALMPTLIVSGKGFALFDTKPIAKHMLTCYRLDPQEK